MIRLLAIVPLFLLISIANADCVSGRRVVYNHAPSYNYAPTVVHAPAVVHTPVVEVPVVKDVVFTKYVPVVPIALVELAVLPTYSAQYVPPPPVQGIQGAQPGSAPPAPIQAPALQATEMSKIMGALERINARLDRLEKGRPVTPEVQAPLATPKMPPAGEATPQPKEEQTTALAVVTNKCAACHSDKTSDKGGNLVLIADGQLAKIDARQANKVLGRSYAGTMPPKDNKLSITPLSDSEVAALVAQYAK